MNYDRLKLIKPLLDHMVSCGFTSGGNCMVIKDGKVICYEQAGVRDLETKAPFSRDTIVRLYSMSKPVTSAAVMLLLQDGKIDLLDRVHDIIPGYDFPHLIQDGKKVPATAPLTIQTLLNMTSGISYPGIGNESEIASDEIMNEIISKLDTPDALGTVEIAKRYSKIPLAFEPGSRFRYGFSADILGAVIEQVSGMSFGNFLQKRLFEPLHMVDTGFYVPAEKQGRLAKVYEQTSHGPLLFTYPNLGISNTMTVPPAFESGGAGLVSTLDDYRNFCQMLLQNGTFEGQQILTPETVRFMTTAKLTPTQQPDLDWESLYGYSYGNLLRTLQEPGMAASLGCKGEYGWDGWLGAYMANDPTNNMAILMMIQRRDSGTNGFTRKLRNIVYSALD